MRSFFRNLYAILIIALPASLFFSYYPVISLGGNHSMNFELSIPLIMLVLFDFVAFINLLLLFVKSKSAPSAQKSSPEPVKGLPGRHFRGITDRQIFLMSLFPFFATLSIFWSLNPLRATLTAGIIWLLYFAVFAILFVTPLLKFSAKLSPLIARVFLWASVIVCIYCWLQGILDISGFSRAETLLCRGCTFYSFGFPHPSGFAIEPQFMGNLLLAPTLFTLFLLVFQRDRLSPKHTTIITLMSALFSATLFFTFSRGAIYAYAVALAAMLIMALYKRSFWANLIIIPVATFLFTLCAQGVLAAISPTSDTFISGTTKAIHQLSLGIIDLRPRNEPPALAPETENDADISQDDIVNEDNAAEEDNDSIFEGYVAESTDIRILLNKLAVQAWAKTPQNIIIGVGLGGAGIAINRYFPELFPSAKEIVQHEGFSLLLELGLIGVILILISLYFIFLSRPARTKLWTKPSWCLILPLVIAYFVTLNFFSGLPNALHIYLLPALFYLILLPLPQTSKKAKGSH